MGQGMDCNHVTFQINAYCSRGERYGVGVNDLADITLLVGLNGENSGADRCTALPYAPSDGDICDYDFLYQPDPVSGDGESEVQWLGFTVNYVRHPAEDNNKDNRYHHKEEDKGRVMAGINQPENGEHCA